MDEIKSSMVALPGGEVKPLEQLFMESIVGPNGEKPIKVTIVGLERDTNDKSKR